MNVLKHFVSSSWFSSGEGKILSGSPYTETNPSGKINVILLTISGTFRNFLEISALKLSLRIVHFYHTIRIIQTDLHSQPFCIFHISHQLQILPQILV